MSQTEIVINVQGGVIVGIFCSDKNAKVLLVDRDAEEGEHAAVTVQRPGQDLHAIVTQTPIEPLHLLAGSDVAAAINAAAQAELPVDSSSDSCHAVMTSHELATVLAALRHWQKQTAAQPGLPPAYPHFDTHQPLTAAEIDRLCERLNTGWGTAHEILT